MTRYELLFLLVACFAIAISIASLLLSRSNQKKQLQLQEKKAALSELQHKVLATDVAKRKHAELRAELVGSHGDRRFIFSNLGPGIARNVHFAFADQGGWSSPVINAQFNEIFPIKEFCPDQRYSCIAALHLAHPPVFTGNYSWEDEDGKSHQTICKIPM